MELELIQVTKPDGERLIHLKVDGTYEKCWCVDETNYDEKLKEATELFEKYKEATEETIVLKSFKTTQDGKSISQSL